MDADQMILAKLDEMTTDINELDSKVNQILIREAGREGEMRGFKKSMALLVTIVTILVNLAQAAIAAYV